MRYEILLGIDVVTDVLFVSGSEDNMFDIKKLAGVRKKMKAKTWLCVVEGADHGMSLKGKAKRGVEVMRERSGFVAAKWLEDRNDSQTECVLRWDEDKGNALGEGWEAGEGVIRKKDTSPKVKKTAEKEVPKDEKKPAIKRRKKG